VQGFIVYSLAGNGILNVCMGHLRGGPWNLRHRTSSTGTV
jgi:hypothetical protein